MIILALALILAGSLSGAVILWLQGAAWWQIALGYVGGGWAGLLGGMAVVMVLRSLAAPWLAGSRPPQVPRQAAPHRRNTLP